MKSERRLIQKKLYFSLLVISIITIAVSLSFYIISTKNYRNKVVSEYINEKSSKAILHFSDKEKLFESNINLLTKWGENGLIHLNDTGNIDLVLIPLIADIKEIFAITLYEDLANEYEIRKDKDSYISRFYNAKEKNKENAFIWKHLDDKAVVLRKWTGSIDYKPEKKIWFDYTNNDSLGVSWYGPYFSESLNKNVLSISSSWKKNDKTYHIIIHVLLKDVFSFFDIFDSKQNEYSFLLNADGDIYNFKGSDNQINNKLRFKELRTPYYKVKQLQIAEAVNIWLDENKSTKTSLQFKLNRVSYWSKFEYLNAEKKYVLGFVVSEDSFSAKIGEGKFLTLLLSLLIFFAGVIFALFFILRYNKQLRKVPKPGISNNNFERDVLQLSKSAESKTLEFKSTIRFNIKAQKNDKAIEQAWLKTVAAFLNTEGGVLLIGVNDEGDFYGIEKDNFENLDKASLHIKNLISKIIGIEYMKFVNIHSGTINNKLIIALVCKQSVKPAYMNIANEELFYIRIGPSSTKLIISQAIEHISNHGYKQLS